MKAILVILCLLTGLLHAEVARAAADTLANEDLQHGELNTNAVQIEPSRRNPNRERAPAPAKRAEPMERTSQPKPARVAPRPAGEPRARSLLPGR
jgi:hypothetical protein